MEVNTAILVIAGFIGGFIGGEVGSGALITLPVLLFLGLPPAIAVGTNMLSAWLINVIAAFEYCSFKKIRYDVVFHLGPIALLGSLVGSNIIADLDPAISNRILAFLFIAILIFLIATLRNPGFGLNPNKKEFTKTQKIVAVPLAFLVGIYGGFFTVAVTTILVMFLITLFKQNFIQATGEAVFIAAILLFGSLIVFATKDLINYQLAIPLAISAGIGSYVGARTALKFGSKWLKGMTIVLVLFIIAKLSLGAF